MNCEKIKRWISDDLDGALTPKKKQRLESHLSSCPACRDYERELRLIQAGSVRIEGPGASPEHLEALSTGIMAKLRLERQEERAARAFLSIWRWARVAAPTVLAIALGVFLFRGGGELPQDEIFSFEGCLDRVFQEIGGDDDIAADFSRFLAGSLLGGGEAVVLEDDIDLWNEPLFWRSLSDEDLGWIEEEIKKGIRS
ncbi:MAG: zf-HC2 domain-containing protein [Candidatus Aminicenantales bacterium]